MIESVLILHIISVNTHCNIHIKEKYFTLILCNIFFLWNINFVNIQNNIKQPDEDIRNFLQLYDSLYALHMIGYVKYFTSDSRKRHHKFSKLRFSQKC